MRVLFVEELRGGYGGAERYAEVLTSALRERGVDVSVLLFAGGGSDTERHLARLDLHGVGWRWLERRFDIGGLRAELAARQATLLHWNFPHPFAFGAGTALLFPWRRPSVVSEHLPNLSDRPRRELMRAFANRAIRQMIVGSPGARAAAIAKWGRRTPPVTAIANAVPLLPASERRRNPGGPLELLFIGRLEEQKNPAFAVDVAAALRRSGRAVRLRMVGVGSQEASLREHAQRTMPDGIEWLGFVADLGPVLGAADVLLHPSLYESGLTLAALEALGSGLPVLASDIPQHRDAGASPALRLLPLGEVTIWAEAVLATVGAGLAAHARSLAERFSPAVMAERTEAVYAAALARR